MSGAMAVLLYIAIGTIGATIFHVWISVKHKLFAVEYDKIKNMDYGEREKEHGFRYMYDYPNEKPWLFEEYDAFNLFPCAAFWPITVLFFVVYTVGVALGYFLDSVINGIVRTALVVEKVEKL